MKGRGEEGEAEKVSLSLTASTVLIGYSIDSLESTPNIWATDKRGEQGRTSWTVTKLFTHTPSPLPRWLEARTRTTQVGEPIP